LKYRELKGADKLIKLWDAYTGEIIKTLQGHSEGVSDIAWSGEGDLIASASDDKTVRIWDLNLVRVRSRNQKEYALNTGR
jgi:WD40 repeat protein